MSNKAIIWDKNQCIEAYNDLMIKIAMSSYAEIHGEELLKENERLKKLPEFQVPSNIEAIIQRDLRKHDFRKSVNLVLRKSYKVANKVAMIFLMISVIFATTMVVSAEFRRAIYKLVFTYEKQYTLIQLDNATSLEFVGSEVYTWEHAFAPTMLPQGYKVVDAIILEDLCLVNYIKDDGRYLDFLQNSNVSETAIQIDTENAQLVQTILINDSEGILVSKDDVNTIIWRVGNVILRITSDEDTDTIISVARNVKLLK